MPTGNSPTCARLGGRPPWTLRELRYLVALADRGHFGRAAEDCHISQPTMSTQIRKLEEFLGATLIERNAKSIALTPKGREVVEKARRIVAQIDDLLSVTRPPLEPLAGALNLGRDSNLGTRISCPGFIPLAKSSYSRLRLVVHEDLTQHLLQRLRSYQIDAALLALPLDVEEFEELPLFDEPFWFACPPQHRLAQLKAVTEADLLGEPILLLADGHCPARSGVGGLRPASRGMKKGSMISVPPASRRSANLVAGRLRLHPAAGAGRAPAAGGGAVICGTAAARGQRQPTSGPGMAARVSAGGRVVAAGGPGAG